MIVKAVGFQVLIYVMSILTQIARTILKKLKVSIVGYIGLDVMGSLNSVMLWIGIARLNLCGIVLNVELIISLEDDHMTKTFYIQKDVWDAKIYVRYGRVAWISYELKKFGLDYIKSCLCQSLPIACKHSSQCPNCFVSMKQDREVAGQVITKDADGCKWIVIYEIGGWCPHCDYTSDEVHLRAEKSFPLDGKLIMRTKLASRGGNNSRLYSS